MWGSHVVPVQLRWFLLAAGLLVLSAGLLALLGCSQEDVSGHLSCVLYDDEVACDQQGCSAPDGGTVAEVPVEATQVVISNEASRFQPDGVYVYAEFAAPESALGVLELDVPRGGAGEPYVAYGEWRGTEQVFRTARTAGTVAVAPPGDRRGQFLLRLDDPGPDGVLGTTDDLTRVLAAGEFGGHATAPLAGEPLATPPPPGDDDGAAVVIDVIDLILEGTEVDPSPPVDDTGSGDGSASGCGGEDVGDSDPGCDGSGSSGGDASGCEGGGGGSGGCEGDGGGGGCDGGGGGGGCEGADLGGGGCEGDYARAGARPPGAAASPRAGSRPHARGPQRLAPLVLVGVVGVWCRRAGRRRRAR